MKMKIPLDLILSHTGNKYELAVAMIVYHDKILEMPELLRDYIALGDSEKVPIIMTDILTGKVKYKYV